MKSKSVGYQPSRSQALFLQTLVPKTHSSEVIVIHHVLVDTPTKLVLQIERRKPSLSALLANQLCTFERVTI